MKLFKKILLQEKEVTFQIERTIKCPPSRLKLICNKGYCDTNPEDSGQQVPTTSFKRSGIIILWTSQQEQWKLEGSERMLSISWEKYHFQTEIIHTAKLSIKH